MQKYENDHRNINIRLKLMSLLFWKYSSNLLLEEKISFAWNAFIDYWFKYQILSEQRNIPLKNDWNSILFSIYWFQHRNFE